jgi:hypothetical protein
MKNDSQEVIGIIIVIIFIIYAIIRLASEISTDW